MLQTIVVVSAAMMRCERSFMFYITIKCEKNDEIEGRVEELVRQFRDKQYGLGRPVHVRTDERYRWYLHTPSPEQDAFRKDIESAFTAVEGVQVAASDNCPSYKNCPCWACR